MLSSHCRHLVAKWWHLYGAAMARVRNGELRLNIREDEERSFVIVKVMLIIYHSLDGSCLIWLDSDRVPHPGDKLNISQNFREMWQMVPICAWPLAEDRRGNMGQYHGNALAHGSNKAVKLHHYSQIFMVRLKQIIILNKTFCRSFTTSSSTPLFILMFIRL